jgi:hypothetical protein
MGGAAIASLGHRREPSAESTAAERCCRAQTSTPIQCPRPSLSSFLFLAIEPRTADLPAAWDAYITANGAARPSAEPCDYSAREGRSDCMRLIDCHGLELHRAEQGSSVRSGMTIGMSRPIAPYLPDG